MRRYGVATNTRKKMTELLLLFAILIFVSITHSEIQDIKRKLDKDED